jgi:hypothetical protein
MSFGNENRIFSRIELWSFRNNISLPSTTIQNDRGSTSISRSACLDFAVVPKAEILTRRPFTMSTSQGVNVRNPHRFPPYPCPSLEVFLELPADQFQVLRWSALVAGIFYGFTHQRTISANNAAAHAHAEYQHKLDLIQKAKAEYAKKNLPPQSKTSGGDST